MLVIRSLVPVGGSGLLGLGTAAAPGAHILLGSIRCIVIRVVGGLLARPGRRRLLGGGVGGGGLGGSTTTCTRSLFGRRVGSDRRGLGGGRRIGCRGLYRSVRFLGTGLAGRALLWCGSGLNCCGSALGDRLGRGFGTGALAAGNGRLADLGERASLRDLVGNGCLDRSRLGLFSAGLAGRALLGSGRGIGLGVLRCRRVLGRLAAPRARSGFFRRHVLGRGLARRGHVKIQFILLFFSHCALVFLFGLKVCLLASTPSEAFCTICPGHVRAD